MTNVSTNLTDPDRTPVVVAGSFRGRRFTDFSEGGFAAFTLGENDPVRFEIVDNSDMDTFSKSFDTESVAKAREIFAKHGSVIVVDRRHDVDFYAPNDASAPTYEELYLNACADGEAHRNELSVTIIRSRDDALAALDQLNEEAMKACQKLGFVTAADIDRQTPSISI